MPVKKRKTTKVTKGGDSSPVIVRSDEALFYPYRNAMRKIIITLLAVLLVYVIVYLGTLIRNEILESATIGKTSASTQTITIEGVGRSKVASGVTEVTFGMSFQSDSAADVVISSESSLSNFLGLLKSLGIDSTDITVENYGVFPNYIYEDDGEESIDGFLSDIDVSVIVRDVSVSDDILALAEEDNVQSFGGFRQVREVGEQNIKEARELALINVRTKISELSNMLGIKFRKISGYYEQNNQDNPESFDPSEESAMVRVHITFEVE